MSTVRGNSPRPLQAWPGGRRLALALLCNASLACAPDVSFGPVCATAEEQSAAATWVVTCVQAASRRDTALDDADEAVGACRSAARAFACPPRWAVFDRAHRRWLPCSMVRGEARDACVGAGWVNP